MSALLLWHGLLGGLLLATRKRVGRAAFLIASLGPIATVAYVLAVASDALGGDPVVELVEWVPSLQLVLDFRVDAFALVFLGVVGFAGTAIFLFAFKYFGSEPKVAMFAGTMTIFAGAMIGLVASDHLLSIFLFWELTTITSYLLIGYDDDKAQARSAALHAAVVTGVGGLAMLGGLVLLGAQSGTYKLSEIVANPPPGTELVGLAWGLVLLGAVTKSAQFPFHGWLPGAMAAPTPASAFLHSATMVKAGIFLVGRLAPAAYASTEWWRPVVFAIGFTTMVIGGWRALQQRDLKLLLAHGTVSQLGFLFLLLGAGKSKLLFGGLALLCAHALFKAALFMVVGAIDHEAGTRDLRKLSGLLRSMPAVAFAGIGAAISMAAIPFTFGFAAKEAAFDGLLAIDVWLIAAAATASVLTVAYTGRFLIGAFGPHDEDQEPAGLDAHTPRNFLLWSPAVLAIAGLVLGVIPGALYEPVKYATIAVYGDYEGKLVVWPGLVPALGWSLASLSVGLLLLWRRELLDAAIALVGRVTRYLPTAEGSFRRFVSGLLSFSDRSSSLIQNGSLPFYLALIASVAVVVPSTAFLAGRPSITLPESGGPLELLLGVVVVVAAVTLLRVRRRFAAVLMLGAVGYGIAGLFALLGGPDLALTQLLVETLAVALFAFVLRYLPADFDASGTQRAPKVLVAVAVAAFVFVGGLITSSVQPEQPVSDTYLADAVPEAQGGNVVNVILVDFRGFDTLGEITVLVVATLGAAALVAPVLRKEDER
ncbi:MAG: DUF4040 domain-containing protein [Acidimicrobiia bacterium]|nr:DUF4040 domain-containing protein [Acidimicrobiia bacterium]